MFDRCLPHENRYVTLYIAKQWEKDKKIGMHRFTTRKRRTFSRSACGPNAATGKILRDIMFAIKRISTLAISTLFLAFASQAMATTTITVGVAANFEIPLRDIAAAYVAANPGNTIAITAGATGTLKAAIIAGGSVNGPYDLFLAANQAAPNDLVTNYASLVQGTAFTYATGYPTLWSNTAGVNISGGLPTNFYSLYGAVAIGDHVTAPYGTAAWSILHAAPYSIASLPDAKVTEYSNIDTTFIAVNTATRKVGFVAKSQVCSKSGGVETYSGKSHYVYTANPIIQSGVAIERSSRSGTQDALLSDFLNYLQTDPAAAAIIQGYCYS
jgi:molybdate transport system substrate-binding protein